MHKRSYRRDVSQRGGYISQKPRPMMKEQTSQPPREPTQHHFTYQDKPPSRHSVVYPPAENTNYTNLRSVNKRSSPEGVTQPQSHYKYKRPREGAFPKRIQLTPHFRKEFQNKEFMRTQPVHINEVVPVSPKIGPYMPMLHPQQPLLGNIQNLTHIPQNFINSPFSGPQRMTFGPKESIMHMMIPPQPVVFDNLMPFPKAPMKLLDSPVSGLQMNFLDEYHQFNLKPGLNSVEEYERIHFNVRLENLYKVLKEVNRVSNKIKFTLISIFRVRVGYRLKPFEKNYLENADRVYRYLLFMYLINGYKESLNFEENPNANDVVWEAGKFRKFFNEESDVSVVSKSILINNRSKRVLNDNRKDYRNSMTEGYKLVKWDSSPRITYIFDNYRVYDPSEILENKEDKNIVLIRMLDVKSIINNSVIFKNLGSMYTNINECVLKMLGYYSLICPDESYIIIISSILPTLTLKQLKIFYLNLSNLLDSSKCDLQIYYLERFIERFLPICLSQNRECWNPIITKIVSQINPLKLTNKKYLTCCISLIRSLKSFCDIFVECEETTVSVFLMTLKYLIESSEDSRILVRGESTDLLIQIWLNPSGKKILIKYMNHDIIRILGSLSGIQSIKLNIWSYLLSKEGKDEIMSSKGVKTEESVLCCIFRKNCSDNNLTKLIGQKELSYIYSLFPTLSLPNKNISTGDIKVKQYLARVALFWYLNNFLKISKNILQFEKLSVVVRLSYMLYKNYFKSTINISNVDSNKESVELVAKELEKNNNLGIFVEHFLIILMNNLGISASCLESANVKLSVMLDMLLFNFSFNSTLSSTANDKKDLIRVENRNFLNLIKLTNNNSVLLLINLFEKFLLFNKFCNSLEPEVREHLDRDHENSCPGVFEVLLNINVITYFINNNVEMLRMFVNYLENIIYHYNPEFTTTFCLNTISSFVISSMVQVMSNFKRLIVENEQPQLKEAIGIIKKTDLYKLLLLYNLNINNLKLSVVNIAISYNPVKETVVTRLKTDTNVDEVRWSGYKKIVLANVPYDNLIKFILIQSYMLTLEFFTNYQYYNSVNNFTFPQPVGELEKQLEDPEQLTEENLLLSIMTKDAVLVDYLCKLMRTDYKLPNYELSYNDKYLNSEVASLSTLLLYRCNFELFDSKKDENEHSNDEGLNCKVGYMIDRITILSVFLDSNAVDKSALFPNVKKIVRKVEFDEMVLEILAEMHNFRGLAKDEGSDEEPESNNELVLYELLYYIVKLSLSGSKETKSSEDQNKNYENNLKTEVAQEKLKTALNLLDKLLSKLSSVNNRSDQEVFNNSINKMFKLKQKHENRTLIEINDSDQEELEVSESNESGDELKTEEQNSNEKESRHYLLPGKDNTRLVFETIMQDKLLWERLNRFPIILNSLIKISPTNNLLLFFSSFTTLQLKLNYQVKHNLTFTDNELNHILTNHEYLFSILNEDLLKIINDQSSDEQELEIMEQFEHGEWFRYYFLYVQLLVRMYEVKHYNNPVVNMDRNFYRNFTMPLVEYEQLSEYEYLSKEIVLYLLNYKQITNDNNIVCYVGSDSKKSLFTYFMKGYNLSETANSNNEKEKQSSGSELEDLYLLLFFLSKISKVNNIRVLQVFVFSIFPILIHTIPNKIIFDYVYDSLINIKLGKYPNSFLFIKNLLLTVLFNWYHKYFFTYNFFIYQYNNNKILDKDFVNQYITKCQNNYDIELTFNFTNIKIPVKYVYQLQLLF